MAVSSIVRAGGWFIAPRATKLKAGVHTRLIAKIRCEILFCLFCSGGNLSFHSFCPQVRGETFFLMQAATRAGFNLC